MAERYSRVSRRVWGDQKFRNLSPLLPSGQALWLRLLIAPEQTCIPGLFQAWEAGIAQALGWTLEAFRKAFEEASGQDMVQADWAVGLVWLPRACEHNPPASPNVIKSWRRQWDELPECPLKTQALCELGDLLEDMPIGFREALQHTFGEDLAEARLARAREPSLVLPSLELRSDQTDRSGSREGGGPAVAGGSGSGEDAPESGPVGGGGEVEGASSNEATGAPMAVGGGAPLVLTEATVPTRKRRGVRVGAAAEKRAASKRVPSDWQPTVEHRDIAVAEMRDFDRELAKFRDHDFKSAHADWDAAFRNWLRSDFGRPTGWKRTQSNFNAGPAAAGGWRPNVR